MPIQDNLNGALLISAIDFILSFVIIGGIGVILALFPLLNRFGRQHDKEKLEHSVPKESGLAGTSPISIPSMRPAVANEIHSGLSDQQLVVLLTAAACEALDGAVRIDRFRPTTAKDWNWAAQGRRQLQSHLLQRQTIYS
jgi:hypothetical protein